MTREQAKELAAIERAAISEHISKTGRTRAVNGFRYVCRPTHNTCFPEYEFGSADTIPSVRVCVEREYTYTTIQNRTRKGYRIVRRFDADLLQLRGLKQVKPELNA